MGNEYRMGINKLDTAHDEPINAEHLPESTTTVLGIDVSHHNVVTDWNRVKRAGIEFAIVRVSHGIKQDRTFRSHLEGARQAGLVVGCYHYFEAADCYQDGGMLHRLRDESHLRPDRARPANSRGARLDTRRPEIGAGGAVSMKPDKTIRVAVAIDVTDEPEPTWVRATMGSRMRDDVRPTCDCGSADASWHGKPDGLRVFCCKACRDAEVKGAEEEMKP